MKREKAQTNDGSTTLFVPSLDEHYHSIHGAYNEAMHVFIDAGLNSINEEPIHLLEIGFGTGLNALLTLRESIQFSQSIRYTGVEAYPVTEEEVEIMNYRKLVNSSVGDLYTHMHQAQWNKPTEITPLFQLHKQQKTFDQIEDIEAFDLIYFDAFAPSAQPELWTVPIFNKMFSALKDGGILVTYCAQGQVKRNMKEAGFIVERLPGPPGKREMTRASKPLKS